MPGDITEYQFKPGESGNPNGRPKGRYKLDVTEEAQKVLEGIIKLRNKSGTEEEVTRLEAILKKFVNMALEGHTKAGEIVLDRAFGKALQKTEMDLKSAPNVTIKGRND